MKPNFIINDVDPFLKEFQLNEPKTPFFGTDLRILISNLLCRFVKREVLESKSNFYKIDLTKNYNFLPIRKINLGHKTS